MKFGWNHLILLECVHSLMKVYNVIHMWIHPNVQWLWTFQPSWKFGKRETLWCIPKGGGGEYCRRELLLMVSFVVQNHVSIQSTQCMLCLKLSPVIKGLQWQRGTHPWRQALRPYCHLGICLFHYDPRPAWLVYLTILTWYWIKGMNPTLTPYRDLHWMIGPMYLKAIRHENHDEHSLRTETWPSRN